MGWVLDPFGVGLLHDTSSSRTEIARFGRFGEVLGVLGVCEVGS